MVVSKRRVVVTGLGIVSPLGNDVKTTWSNVLAGRSGIGSITHFDASTFRSQIAGEVKNFNPKLAMDPRDIRRTDLFIQYGLLAGQEAFSDSGLEIADENADRIGVNIGAGIGGLKWIEEAYANYQKGGAKKISPFFVPGSITNMISGYLAIKLGLKGPNLAVVTACTTGLHAIGLGARLIQSGDADVMICGGAEAAVTPLAVGGFSSAQALSSRNDDPSAASRPWDKDRDGFVLGEGAGVLLLEEYESAKKRSAKIYGEVAGFGMSCDAYHITAPDIDGPKRSMELALNDAKLNREDIQYVNAHGTSTLVGDKNECNAIKSVFGQSHSSKLIVSSIKSMTGHLLAAAGGFESAISLLAIQNQVIPPTINLENQDPECDLDFCANEARDYPVTTVIKNNFGFGGTNGSLVFKKIN